jgi:hypothetical protein
MALAIVAYGAIWGARNSDLLKRATQLFSQMRVTSGVPATEEI